METERKVLVWKSESLPGWLMETEALPTGKTARGGSTVGSLLRLWIPKAKACLLHDQVVQAWGCNRGAI